ncbi:Renal dipeptidase family [Kalmanozyma brasiliensis GHG001]|uniref:Dipeptidase n=1 Tax=Kalmanozyma brasiliensis (strain GHG001) TaxID=1365824 RepID=V5EWW8_KALBG|nr:Renal dipeptidase family [Kalmanozyma brasiliensis GHG001]EST07898.1 Renal dipeptidase family [Kalmanozyma brasiliensis GHG001]
MSSIHANDKSQDGLLPSTSQTAAPAPRSTLKAKLKLALCTLAIALVLFARPSIESSVSKLLQPGTESRCDVSGASSNWRCRNARKHALRLLSKHPLIDGHVDVPVVARYKYGNKIDSIPFDAPAFPNGSYPMYSHVDIPRLREGKSGGFFWSSYVVCPNSTTVGDTFERAATDIAVRDTLEQLDVIRQMTDKYADDFALVGSVKEARQAFKQGKMISFIGIEGAHSLGNSLYALRAYAALFSNQIPGPVRYLTLTHTCHNVFADSAGEEPKKWNGLSPFGKHLVTELNRLAIVPDLSHVSDDTALQTIEVSRGPVMLSHSAARHFKEIQRNVPDAVLEKLASAGKDIVVMINAYPGFIGGSEDLDQYVRHIEYVSDKVGRRHVGVGTDFDGIMSVPKGLEDVRRYPDLVARLVERGWSDREIIGFVGENVLRVLEDAERVAKEMRKEGVRPDNTNWHDIFGSQLHADL